MTDPTSQVSPFKKNRTLSRIDLPILLVFGSTLAVFYFFTQPVLTLKNGLIWDAVHYHQMLQQTAAEHPLTARKPFVYRAGLPMLAGWTLRAFGGDPQAIMQKYNFAFGLLGYIVFVLFLMQLIPHRGVVYLLALLYLTNYSSPFRLGAIYPFYVDPPAMLISMLILYLNVIWKKLTLSRLVILCLLAVLGVWFREYVLAAPLAAISAHRIRLSQAKPWIIILSRPQFILSLLPFAAGLMAFFFIQLSVNPTGNYTFSGHALFSLRFILNNPWKMPVATLVCYGPILLIGLFITRSAWKNLLNQPMLLMFSFVILALAVLGGTHTERFLYWGAPTILPILGLVLLHAERRPPEQAIFFLSILTSLQLLATRAFLPLPDIDNMSAENLPEFFLLAPYGEHAHYFHIWAHGMPPETQRIMLVQYGMLFIIAITIRLWPWRKTFDKL